MAGVQVCCFATVTVNRFGIICMQDASEPRTECARIEYAGLPVNYRLLHQMNQPFLRPARATWLAGRSLAGDLGVMKGSR